MSLDRRADTAGRRTAVPKTGFSQQQYRIIRLHTAQIFLNDQPSAHKDIKYFHLDRFVAKINFKPDFGLLYALGR